METKSLKYWKIFAFILIALNITLIVLLLLGRPPRLKEDNETGKYIL